MLWGWRGKSLTGEETDRLAGLATWLDSGDSELDSLLTAQEVVAMRSRVHQLGEVGRLPGPSRSWPAIPWPAF